MTTALDRLMPAPRLVEVDFIDLAAPTARVWELVRHGDLAQSPFVRALFAIRTLPSRLARERAARASIHMDDLVSSPERPGFQILVEEPPHEVAVGATGKVWHVEIPFVHLPSAEAFAAFAETGFVKVAWAIRLSPLGEGETRLVFELRVDATDDESWRKFRRYFRVIGPASRFIRRSLLATLARDIGIPKAEENAGSPPVRTRKDLAAKDIMPTIKAVINRHPVLTYFALTFAISWGGFLIVVGPDGIPATSQEQFEALLPIAVLALLAGPSIAGILLTGLVHGGAGLREMLSHLLWWRVGGRWYAVALLTAPLLMTTILLALSLLSPEFLPGILTTDDRASLLLFGIAVALGAGIFEELGWTGFAVPALRRHSVLASGLIVGVLWAGWHVLPAVWISGITSGALSRTSYLLDPFLYLMAFRVLMVWVYDRTDSLLVAILMHLSLTGSTRILGPIGIAGVPLLTFDLVWAAVLWVFIAANVVAHGGAALGGHARKSARSTA